VDFYFSGRQIAGWLSSDSEFLLRVAAPFLRRRNWIKGSEQETINSVLLGESIGKHEAIEFVPLKRFTDLLVRQFVPNFESAAECP
jgi:hypothetical protein